MNAEDLSLKIQCLVAEIEAVPNFGTTNWLDIQALAEWFEIQTRVKVVVEDGWEMAYSWDEQGCFNVEFLHKNRRAGLIFSTVSPAHSGWWIVTRILDGKRHPADSTGRLDDTYIQNVLDKTFWNCPK